MCIFPIISSLSTGDTLTSKYSYLDNIRIAIHARVPKQTILTLSTLYFLLSDFILGFTVSPSSTSLLRNMCNTRIIELHCRKKFYAAFSQFSNIVLKFVILILNLGILMN